MKPFDLDSRKTINANGRIIDLSSPKVMGILNITPDSFFDGGKYLSKENIISRVRQMLDEGADMIDIGAYSSRPGAENISENEELNRLLPVIELIRNKYESVIVSVDTFRAKVAQKVVSDFQVDIINDISCGSFDHAMFETVAELHVPYIIMHMQGTPQNMQQNPNYQNVLKEILYYFSEKISKLKLLGVNDIIIDPGFGFGKTIEHNYQLVSRLEDFKILNLPILVGFSRKSMIYKLLNTTPEYALNGTSVLNTLALIKGASILRVHDVKEAVETIKILNEVSRCYTEN